MAQTNNRKINIWINGKQVVNSVKDIRNSMRNLINEQSKMTIGSKAYIAQSKKIKDLKGILDKHNQTLGRVKKGWAKIKEQITSVAAGNIISNLFSNLGSKVSSAFRGMLEGLAKFKKGVTNAFTLLGQDTIAQFGGELEEGVLSISELGFALDDVNQSLFDTLSAGVDASEAIGFMNTSAELAIGGVTDLSIATDGLTTVINAFKLETSDADEVANAFFTAQKFGKTNVEELSQSIGKAAPIAASLGISYKELLSAGSTLTLGGIKTKESFTALKATFSNLIKPSADAEKIMRKLGVPVGATEVKAMGFTKTLELLNKAVQKAPNEVGKFITSTEALTAVQALSGKGLEKYKEILNAVQTDIGENSSLSKAYAMQQETLSQAMARAAAKTKLMSIHLGEKLAPFIKEGIALFNKLTESIIEFTDWVGRNIETIILITKVIVIATVAIVSYNAAIKLSVFWTESIKNATLRKLIVDKANVIITQTQRAVTLLYAAAQALLTGNLKKAGKAMRLFNMILKASPIGLVAAGITAAVVAFALFNRELSEVQKTQKLINDLHNTAAKNIAKEKTELDLLLIVARDENRSKAERTKAIEKLNKLSPKYLGSLTLENINTKKATDATNAYITALTKKALVTAANEKLVELAKKEIDLATKGTGAELSFFQKLGNTVSSFTNSTQAAINRAETSMKNYSKTEADFLKERTNLEKFISENIDLTPEPEDKPAGVSESTSSNLPTGGFNEDAQKELDKRYDDYLKSYESFQNQLQGFQQKYFLDGLNQHQKERAELQAHWDQILETQQITIDALVDLGEDRTKEETELLKDLNTQRIFLIQQRQNEELALELKQGKELEKAKLDAEKKISDAVNEFALTEKDREIQAAFEKYQELIKLAKEFGFETVELYEAMKQSFADIDEKFKGDGENRDPFFGYTEEEWTNFKDITFAAAAEVSNAWSAYNDLRRQQDDARVARIDQNYNDERSNLDALLESKLISENVYNKRLSALDKKTETQKKKIAYDQAKRERDLKLFQAGVNLAAGIVQIWSTWGWNPPVAITLTGLLGLTAGLQIGAIASAPLPKLAGGGRIKKETTAIIGEAGEEIVFSNKMITDPETGPILNYLADVQEGKKPNIASYASPNFVGMKKAIGRAKVPSQESNSNFVQSESNTNVNDLVEENKMLNTKFDQMLTIWTDPNFRLKASLVNDEFKQFQEDDEIGQALADI